MNRSKFVYCLLSTLIAFLSAQPSFAQNNLSSEGASEAMLNTPSANEGELLYSNSFTARKESGWSTYSDANTSRYYRDGKYHVRLNRGDWSAWSFSGNSFSDFVVQVNTSQEVGPDDNDYGIVTRYADAGNYSLFLISGDGFYGYARRENNQWTPPLKWTVSDSINKGNATNSIEVVSQGENLAFWVNGVKLGDFTDSNPRPGDIGLWVESFQEGGVQIGFDEIRIWALKE